MLLSRRRALKTPDQVGQFGPDRTSSWMPKGTTKMVAVAALKRAAKGDDLDEAPPMEPLVPEPEPEAGAAGAAGVCGLQEDIMYWDGTITEERSATGYCHTRQDAGTSSPAHVTVRP